MGGEFAEGWVPDLEGGTVEGKGFLEFGGCF